MFTFYREFGAVMEAYGLNQISGLTETLGYFTGVTLQYWIFPLGSILMIPFKILSGYTIAGALGEVSWLECIRCST